MALRKVALNELVILRDQMKFQNLNQYRRDIGFEDGSKIECWAIGDQSFINIYAPVRAGEEIIEIPDWIPLYIIPFYHDGTANPHSPNDAQWLTVYSNKYGGDRCIVHRRVIPDAAWTIAAHVPFVNPGFTMPDHSMIGSARSYTYNRTGNDEAGASNAIFKSDYYASLMERAYLDEEVGPKFLKRGQLSLYGNSDLRVHYDDLAASNPQLNEDLTLEVARVKVTVEHNSIDQRLVKGEIWVDAFNDQFHGVGGEYYKSQNGQIYDVPPFRESQMGRQFHAYYQKETGRIFTNCTLIPFYLSQPISDFRGAYPMRFCHDAEENPVNDKVYITPNWVFDWDWVNRRPVKKFFYNRVWGCWEVNFGTFDYESWGTRYYKDGYVKGTVRLETTSGLMIEGYMESWNCSGWKDSNGQCSCGGDYLNRLDAATNFPVDFQPRLICYYDPEVADWVYYDRVVVMDARTDKYVRYRYLIIDQKGKIVLESHPAGWEYLSDLNVGAGFCGLESNIGTWILDWYQITYGCLYGIFDGGYSGFPFGQAGFGGLNSAEANWFHSAAPTVIHRDMVEVEGKWLCPEDIANRGFRKFHSHGSHYPQEGKIDLVHFKQISMWLDDMTKREIRPSVSAITQYGLRSTNLGEFPEEEWRWATNRKVLYVNGNFTS